MYKYHIIRLFIALVILPSIFLIVKTSHSFAAPYNCTDIATYPSNPNPYNGTLRINGVVSAATTASPGDVLTYEGNSEGGARGAIISFYKNTFTNTVKREYLSGAGLKSSSYTIPSDPLLACGQYLIGYHLWYYESQGVCTVYKSGEEQECEMPTCGTRDDPASLPNPRVCRADSSPCTSSTTTTSLPDDGRRIDVACPTSTPTSAPTPTITSTPTRTPTPAVVMPAFELRSDFSQSTGGRVRQTTNVYGVPVSNMTIPGVIDTGPGYNCSTKIGELVPASSQGSKTYSFFVGFPSGCYMSLPQTLNIYPTLVPNMGYDVTSPISVLIPIP